MQRHLYFAYSAFIHPDEAQLKLPGAVYVDKARVTGHRMDFVSSAHDPSKGHCHLVSGLESSVETWGIVYEVPDLETHLRYTGYDVVDVVAEADGRRYACRTLAIAEPGKAMKVPPEKYARIMEGAKVRGFPQSYSAHVVATYRDAADAPAS